MLERLTAREGEILSLVCRGLSNKQIARALGIADGTVKVHLHRMYDKLAVHNRAALALRAIERLRMTKDERYTLDVLDGCPSGATRDSLLVLGCKPATLDKLVRAGFVSTRIAGLANPRNLEVTL